MQARLPEKSDVRGIASGAEGPVISLAPDELRAVSLTTACKHRVGYRR
jgi:hypothetical protein